MTNREKYVAAIDVCREAGRDDLVEFLEGRVTLLDKKNASEKKLTPNQIENEKLKADILDFCEDGQSYTVTDFMKAIESLDGLSNQRVNAIVNQLAKAYKLTKYYIKRKAYFRLPTAEEVEGVDESGED